jgi:hypothetical protein
MNCNKVVMFYESHSDAAPANTIIELTDFFKEYGIKSYCFEEPSNEPKSQMTKLLSKAIKDIESRIEILSKTNSNEIEIIKYILNFSRESYKSTIELANLTNDKDLHYCSIDMTRSERTKMEKSVTNEFKQIDIRNEYMYKKVLEQCDKYGDVVTLVGAVHFDIAHFLRRDGIEVKEYFIKATASKVSEEIEEDPYLQCFNNLQDKPRDLCHEYKMNGLILDLDENPYLDAAALIKQDLMGSANIHHDEL